jgi:hypothetical protein
MSSKFVKLGRKLLLKWAMKLDISGRSFSLPPEEWEKTTPPSGSSLPAGAPTNEPALLDMLRHKATQIYGAGNDLRFFLEAAGRETEQRQTPSKRHLLMQETAKEVVRAISDVADILNTIRKGEYSVDELAAKAKSLWKLTQTLMAKEYSLEMEELEQFHLYLQRFLGILGSVVEYQDYSIE